MNHIKLLLAQLPHKVARPYRTGTEIRVHNLESGRSQAQSIIDKAGLNLRIGEIHVQLRSFIVYETEAQPST
ncbi:hypothetical protein ACR78H_25045 [Sphingobacterium siyangense]|uniref:hypothetical protein n=1 Tax=Sphingobacterium siyangense TaxID=459529 RepID=UPI003DA3E048